MQEIVTSYNIKTQENFFSRDSFSNVEEKQSDQIYFVDPNKKVKT